MGTDPTSGAQAFQVQNRLPVTPADLLHMREDDVPIQIMVHDGVEYLSRY